LPLEHAKNLFQIGARHEEFAKMLDIDDYNHGMAVNTALIYGKVLVFQALLGSRGFAMIFYS
jgi:hypothetical protein